jgi:hypothetical protein
VKTIEQKLKGTLESYRVFDIGVGAPRKTTVIKKPIEEGKVQAEQEAKPMKLDRGQLEWLRDCLDMMLGQPKKRKREVYEGDVKESGSKRLDVEADLV